MKLKKFSDELESSCDDDSIIGQMKGDKGGQNEPPLINRLNKDNKKKEISGG